MTFLCKCMYISAERPTHECHHLGTPCPGLSLPNSPLQLKKETAQPFPSARVVLRKRGSAKIILHGSSWMISWRGRVGLGRCSASPRPAHKKTMLLCWSIVAVVVADSPCTMVQLHVASICFNQDVLRGRVWAGSSNPRAHCLSLLTCCFERHVLRVKVKAGLSVERGREEVCFGGMASYTTPRGINTLSHPMPLKQVSSWCAESSFQFLRVQKTSIIIIIIIMLGCSNKSHPFGPS